MKRSWQQYGASHGTCFEGTLDQSYPYLAVTHLSNFQMWLHRPSLLFQKGLSVEHLRFYGAYDKISQIEIIRLLLDYLGDCYDFRFHLEVKKNEWHLDVEGVYEGEVLDAIQKICMNLDKKNLAQKLSGRLSKVFTSKTTAFDVNEVVHDVCGYDEEPSLRCVKVHVWLFTIIYYQGDFLRVFPAYDLLVHAHIEEALTAVGRSELIAVYREAVELLEISENMDIFSREQRVDSMMQFIAEGSEESQRMDDSLRSIADEFSNLDRDLLNFWEAVLIEEDL